MGVIPIVNENDTVAVSEIKFGDNDTLSAITAAMIHADLLFLMTDVDCLYDKNPRSHPDAQPIEVVEDIGALQADGRFSFSRSTSSGERNVFREQERQLTCDAHSLVSSAGSALGTGGMSTKIVAARLATSAGVTTVITRSSNPGNISRIAQHVLANRPPGNRSPGPRSSGQRSPDSRSRASSLEHPSSKNGSAAAANGEHEPRPTAATATSPSRSRAHSTSSSSLLSVSADDNLTLPLPLHTRFLPSTQPIRDRSFWILHGLRPHGDVYIDGGCYKALLDKAGLLPVGVVDVDGGFSGHECVRLLVVERNPQPQPDDDAGDWRPWRGEPLDVGRAIVNYSSTEVTRIMGRQSKEIEGLLGYADSGYVAEREHITFFQSRPQTPTPVNGVVESEVNKA